MIDGLLNPVHILILFFIVVVIFGPKRLPEMGRKIGETLRELNSATSEIRSQIGIDEVAGSVKDIKSTLSLSGLAGAAAPRTPTEQPAANVQSDAAEATVPAEAASEIVVSLPEQPATCPPTDEAALGVEQFGRLPRSGRSPN
jgi:sec-independent protein translocase protein TatA